MTTIFVIALPNNFYCNYSDVRLKRRIDFNFKKIRMPSTCCPLVVDPLTYLSPTHYDNKQIILVLLNQNWISSDGIDDVFYQRFKTLWKKSLFKASVDGGMNILHNINENLSDSEEKFIPDLLSGDFDSVKSELVDLYKNLGTEVIHTPDQNYTDFTKCLQVLGKKYESSELPQNADVIVVLSGFTDRFDHSMANLNTLFTACKYLPKDTQIYMLLGYCVICLLQSGRNVIKLENCNVAAIQLLPISCPATVSTTGFKQDLNEDCLSFNDLPQDFEIISEEVTIATDHHLILMVTMAKTGESI